MGRDLDCSESHGDAEPLGTRACPHADSLAFCVGSTEKQRRKGLIMRRVHGLVSSLAGVMLACGSASGQAQDLADILAQEMYVADFTLSSVASPEDRPPAFQAEFDFKGERYTVALDRHSVRAPGYKVLIDDGTGVLREVPAPPVSTYRGEVLELPGSTVTATLNGVGLDAQIALPGKANETWTIQPLAGVVNGQPEGMHVVFSSDDLLVPPYECGLDDVLGDDHDHDHPAPTPTPRADIIAEAELAWDVDFQAFQELGSSVNQSIAEVEGITNNVNIAYERDVEITHSIVFTIVRTSAASNPYTTGEIGPFLNQVSAEWTGPQGSVQRDLVHVLTGRDLTSNGNSGVIGVAPGLGVVCNQNLGIAISENLSNSFFETGLVAHELGHDWSAPHCNQSPNVTNPCNIMCSGLGGCDGLGQPNFGPGAIGFITNHRDQIPCLDDILVGALDIPFSETFPSTFLSDQRWESSTGAFAITFDNLAPTPPLVGSFTGAGSITTLDIAAGTPTDGPLVVKFDESQIGLAGGEQLLVEVENDPDGTFQVMGTLTASGDPGQTPFTERSFLVPPGSLEDGVQFRFRSAGAVPPGASWRIEDIRIEDQGGFTIPFGDSFPDTDLNRTIWPTVSSFNTEVTEDAQNEPSPPFSLSLPQGSIESGDILAASSAGEPHVLRFSIQPDPILGPGNSLQAFYRNDGGSLVLLDQFSADDFPSDAFTDIALELPQDAFHDELAVRFTFNNFLLVGTWFIDDVLVEPGTAGNPCPPDLTGPGGDGTPDGTVDANDFFFYLALFADSDPRADLTGPGGDGTPDGTIDANDFFFYLNLFASGCP